MEPSNILSVKGLKVKFDKHLILDDISFDVPRDSTLAIIGPNGAGKTVLFKAILGLIPYEGTVTKSADFRVGYVPQKVLIGKDVPLTVCEFLEFKESDPKVIMDQIIAVGLGGEASTDLHRGKRLLKTRMGALSGGELQRVLIAFALLGKPNILLFDEPTSGIDVAGEETIYTLIDKLQRDRDLTIVFISHELEIVYKYAKNVLCLNKEKICFGEPKEVIDKNSLQKLYGEDIHIYDHKGHKHNQ